MHTFFFVENIFYLQNIRQRDSTQIFTKSSVRRMGDIYRQHLVKSTKKLRFFPYFYFFGYYKEIIFYKYLLKGSNKRSTLVLIIIILTFV
jgi:hypothetical protein